MYRSQGRLGRHGGSRPQPKAHARICCRGDKGTSSVAALEGPRLVGHAPKTDGLSCAGAPGQDGSHDESFGTAQITPLNESQCGRDARRMCELPPVNVAVGGRFGTGQSGQTAETEPAIGENYAIERDSMRAYSALTARIAKHQPKFHPATPASSFLHSDTAPRYPGRPSVGASRNCP
jgi:hypothetical protein